MSRRVMSPGHSANAFGDKERTLSGGLDTLSELVNGQPFPNWDLAICISATTKKPGLFRKVGAVHLD
jgi:hypothetical protein